jgi:hypothetical protein
MVVLFLFTYDHKLITFLVTYQTLTHFIAIIKKIDACSMIVLKPVYNLMLRHYYTEIDTVIKYRSDM